MPQGAPRGPSIEAVRDYWNRRPCNLRHSEAAVGTREYFDQVEQRKYLVEPHIPNFAEFDRWRGKRVLEIGCGIGTDTTNFCRAGADVVAVDLSSESLALTRQRLKAYSLHAELHEANAEELDFLPDNHFDLVYSFGVIHHTPNPRKVVQQAIRVLKPGGELRVMVYNRWSYKALSVCLPAALQGRFDFASVIRENSEAQFGSPVTYVYDAEEATALVHGLTIDRMWVDHIFPYVVEDYRQYRYRKHWWFQVMPDFVFQRATRHLGWHRLIVAHRDAEPAR